MDDNIPYEELPNGPRFGVRHVQTILLVSLFVFGASIRLTVPQTIEAMTSNGSIHTNNWTSNQTVISSFYWGFIVVPIFGGKLVTSFGIKQILTIAVLINAALSVLTPMSFRLFGMAGMIVIRVLQGLCVGQYELSCYSMLSYWIPPQEMARTMGMLYSGYTFGYMITIVPSASICASLVGWPAMYYLVGCMGYLWVIPWLMYGCNSPTTHWAITTEEKLYIQASLASRERTTIIPWLEIFASLPMTAIIISIVAKGCMDSLVLNEIFTHINSTMDIEVENTGFILGFPYVIRIVMITLGGLSSDWMVNKHFLSRTNARKIFNTIGTIIPAIALLFIGNCTSDQTTKYIFNLIVVVAASSATYHGCLLNVMDLSSTFCGTLLGIASFFYTLFSLILPLVADVVVKHTESMDSWRTLFIQVSCINIFAGLFYNFFASGKIQRWSPVSKMKIYGSIGRSDEKVVVDSSF